MIWLYLVFLFLGGVISKSLSNYPQQATEYEPYYYSCLLKVVHYIYDLLLIGVTIFYFGTYFGIIISLVYILGIFHIASSWIISIGLVSKSENFRYYYTFSLFVLFGIFFVGIIVFFIWSLFSSEYKSFASYFTIDSVIFVASIMVLLFILKLGLFKSLRWFPIL